MKDRPAALGRRSVILVTGTWTATALGVVATILTARWLGPEAVGILGFGFGVAGIVGALLLPGLSQAHVKRVAEGQDVGRCVATMLGAQLALQITQVVVLLVVVRWWSAVLPAGVPVGVVVALLVAQILTSLAGAFTGALLGLERATAYAGTLLAGRGCRVVATAAVLAWHPDVGWIAATYVLEAMVVLLVAAGVVLGRRGVVLRAPDRAILRSYWAHARPLLWTSPVSLLQDSLDRVAVAHWAGLTAAGHYQVARALWEVLGTLNAYPFQMLFARLSRLFATRTAETETEARRLFAAAVDHLLFLVTPAALLLWALRDVVVSVLYGGAFLPAAAPLTALIAAALLQTALNPYHFVLYALDAHARFVPVVFARFVLYLVALALLVPAAGAVGAALVRLLVVIVPAWTFVRWARELAGVRFPTVTWLYLAAFAAGAAASEAARFALGPLGWPAVPVGAAVAALATAAAIVGIGHPAPRANLAYAALVLRLSRRAD